MWSTSKPRSFKSSSTSRSDRGVPQAPAHRAENQDGFGLSPQDHRSGCHQGPFRLSVQLLPEVATHPPRLLHLVPDAQPVHGAVAAGPSVTTSRPATWRDGCPGAAASRDDAGHHRVDDAGSDVVPEVTTDKADQEVRRSRELISFSSALSPSTIELKSGGLPNNIVCIA